MKKAISLVLATVLCLSLCACNIDSNSQATTETTESLEDLLEFWEDYLEPTTPSLYSQIKSKCETWINWYDGDISIEISNIEKAGNYYTAYGIIRVYDSWGYLDEIDRFHIKFITVSEHGWVQIDWEYFEYE